MHTISVSNARIQERRAYRCISIQYTEVTELTDVLVFKYTELTELTDVFKNTELIDVLQMYSRTQS